MSLEGDFEASPVLSRDWFESIRTEANQQVRLRMLAHVTRSILERAGAIYALMRAAAVSDPEIAVLRLSHQEQRLTGQTEFVRMLADAGPLRAGLSIKEAGELYWIMASPELHHILTAERDWSNDQYETWLYQGLLAQLLPPAEF